MSASTSMMVPKEHLARVSGANQAIRGVVQVAAPPLGALLLSLLPLHSIMLIDVATAALAITPLLLVAIPQPKTTVSDDSDGLVRAVWRDVRAGVAYVRAWRSLGAMILLATAVNLLLGPAFSLLPLLVTDHFGGGATELAGVQSAFGFGIVAGGQNLLRYYVSGTLNDTEGRQIIGLDFALSQASVVVVWALGSILCTAWQGAVVMAVAIYLDGAQQMQITLRHAQVNEETPYTLICPLRVGAGSRLVQDGGLCGGAQGGDPALDPGTSGTPPPHRDARGPGHRRHEQPQHAQDDAGSGRPVGGAGQQEQDVGERVGARPVLTGERGGDGRRRPHREDHQHYREDPQADQEPLHGPVAGVGAPVGLQPGHVRSSGSAGRSPVPAAGIVAASR